MDPFLQKLFLRSVFHKFAYNREIGENSRFEAFRIV